MSRRAQHKLGACPDCGLSHAAAARQAALRRLLPASFAEVNEAYPCRYGIASKTNNTGYVRFMRDCQALGMWAYPRKELHDRRQPGRPGGLAG